MSDLREEAMAAATKVLPEMERGAMLHSDFTTNNEGRARVLADLLLAWHARGVAAMRESAARRFDMIAEAQEQAAQGYDENTDWLGRSHPARSSARQCREAADNARAHAAAIRALPAPEGSER